MFISQKIWRALISYLPFKIRSVALLPTISFSRMLLHETFVTAGQLSLKYFLNLVILLLQPPYLNIESQFILYEVFPGCFCTCSMSEGDLKKILKFESFFPNQCSVFLWQLLIVMLKPLGFIRELALHSKRFVIKERSQEHQNEAVTARYIWLQT